MTCYIPEDQWPQVGAWIWKNWDVVNGISFLPSADEGHVYEQAPYEDITKEEYEAREKLMPEYINWSFEEAVDNTTASQEVACTAGVCEI
jgi:ribonucleoside-diphosphate reductase alpha chain